ncbi:hypothetical protein F5887DRAFT_1172479 [Amanita rubescens]|nr:hypothetical protein F5887DRAFT_1172479 [Amanita rubescens]
MPPPRLISTLCPKRLQPSDFIDISGLSAPSITLPCGKATIQGYNIKDLAFPPNTRGFFYYHTPPKAPPFVGELRFRCTNSLEDFPNGKDLLSINKFNPWSISLYALTHQIPYLSLREQLILDDLASQTTLDTWFTTKALCKVSHFEPKRPVLYYFRQPFFFRFDSRKLAFYTATKDQLGFCKASNLIGDYRAHSSGVYPYGGSGVVQLERYVRPRRPEEEAVVLRVLKIVEPVKDLIEDYDGHVQRPTEGALIKRIRSTSFPATILKTSVKGLAVLPHNFEDL